MKVSECKLSFMNVFLTTHHQSCLEFVNCLELGHACHLISDTSHSYVGDDCNNKKEVQEKGHRSDLNLRVDIT